MKKYLASATLLLSGVEMLFAGEVNIPKKCYLESVENRGGIDHVLYIWRDGKKIRYEALMGTQLLKTFVDPDANKTTGLFDDTKQFAIIPFSPTKSGSNSGEVVFDVIFSEKAIFTPLGEEAVRGSICKKYRVEAEDDGAILCWIDKASGIPLKLSDKDGKHEAYWRRFSNNVSMVDMFNVPNGYTEKQ